MSKLIMMRHGESCWNQKNIFTGWVDIPLSSKGIEESLAGGSLIKDIPIDVIFTSSLVRAQMSAFLAISLHTSGKIPVVIHPETEKMGKWGQIHNDANKANCIPTFISWELNERMYGTLQGLNKAETAQKFGAEQVKIWRRSFDVAPPQGESLAMTTERTIPYFKNKILPYLKNNQNVYICAHGNSMRAICMHLDNLSHEQVLNLEIATGIPIIYEYREQQFIKQTATR